VYPLQLLHANSSTKVLPTVLAPPHLTQAQSKCNCDPYYFSSKKQNLTPIKIKYKNRRMHRPFTSNLIELIEQGINFDLFPVNLGEIPTLHRDSI
jgi:hypothetical protein